MSLQTKVAKANAMPMAGRPGMYGGDPGLFGFLGKVAKGALGGAVGFATGGVGGAIRGAGFGPQMQQPQMPPLPGPGPGVFGRTGQMLIPGGKTGREEYSSLPPKGHRLNKTDYFLKDGTYVPAGTRFVKTRRRNSLNPRALSRAMARLEGAKKASKSIGRISIRKKC